MNPRARAKANRVFQYDKLEDFPEAGDYFLREDSDGVFKGMFYVCPCGCKVIGYLRFRFDDKERPSWVWDGNQETPTLSPSVNHVGHWHGHLKNGEWIPCE